MYKKFMLLLMIALSFPSEAMLNKGFKKVVAQSILQKRIMRSMNPGNGQEEKYKVLSIKNCTSMVCILGGYVIIDRLFPAINTPERMQERIEYLEELDAKKKLKSEY